MRTWNLTTGDPLCLTLAADARLGKVDYANDQIWSMNWQSGAPIALAIETTFGLRARSFRIFPRFSEGDLTFTAPSEFDRQPVVHQAFPNYIALRLTPISGIDVFYEIWVPSSQTLAGRLTFTNHTPRDRSIRLNLAAQLAPNEGQRMAALEIEAASVLSGKSADISPIVLMTGGSRPGSGSFPALRQDILLKAEQSQAIIWTHAALSSPTLSFAAARQLAFRNWDAEIARLEMFNSGALEFYTGNPDWDAAMKWSQKQALSLIVSPEPGLPHPSIVLSRQPDQGYSPRGDGSDYSHLWNGQSPLDVFLISDILHHSEPELVKGLVRNYLAVQSEDGFIDFKPGIARQRSRVLATPLLATLTWQIYQTGRDRKFLEDAYPSLVEFIENWFSPEHDRDQDGIPEWDHPIQSGYEDHPLFASWHDWSQGINIECAESPSLCAFLLHELDALSHMAAELNLDRSPDEFEAHSHRLNKALEECWSEEQGIFFERDRDTHTSLPPVWLGERTGPGTIQLQGEYAHPIRLVIKIITGESGTRHPHLVIHGTSISGNNRIEEISEEQFKWLPGRGSLTGERIYQAIDRLDIENIAPEDQVIVHSAGFQSLTISQLLPLWSGQLPVRTAEQLVGETISNPLRFWQPFGIPACVEERLIPEEDEVCLSCDPLWNGFIIAGLQKSGYTQEAAELFTRIMNATVSALKIDGGFRRYFHPVTGQGMGELNHLSGLPPVGLFLRLLGIQIHTPTRVEIAGENPFPWPVTVQYRGLTILRAKEKTTIIFADGQTVEVSGPDPQVVSLEDQ